MPDKAFALSPISARATQPSEEDYEAIREAFMETSRGRWFLGEYAKRNRNADTRMVLDAVERIELSLAAQKQSELENGLAEALGGIKRAVDQARSVAAAALEQAGFQDALGPVHRGARIIREISWRWREIGADSRICDLIDSQITAIEEACAQIASTDPKPAISAAIDLIEQRVAEFGETDRPIAPAAKAAAPSPSPAAPDQISAAAVEAARVNAIKSAHHAAAAAPAATTDANATPWAEGMAPEKPTDATADKLDISDEPAMTAEAAQAYDEAVLDMVAMEMAAPDPADPDDEFIDPNVFQAPGSQPAASPEIAAAQPGAAPAPAVRATIEPSLRSSPEQSLGSTLIESGIVRKPSPSRSDPLAPIRRMSQAERIALFS